MRNLKSRRRSVLLQALLGAAIGLGASSAAQAAEPTRVIVAFKPGAEAAGRAAVAAARGAVKLELGAVNAVAVELPSAALAGLQRNPAIDYVEADVKRYPLAFATPTGIGSERAPYGVALVQADQLTMAAARKVCIIDSGFSQGHEDLPGGGVSGDDDPNGAGSWNVDENHHGTHVAGTIAAVSGNGQGVTSVAPGVQLHIVKVFDAAGWAYSSTLAAAAIKCKDAGANVISMSLGGSLKSRTEETTFNNLLKGNVLSIAAAGNAGNRTSSYPASYSSVMSVAAVDQGMVVASFSQYNKQVEIAAPGVGVLSTVPMGTGGEGSVTIGVSALEAFPMDGSPAGNVTALLANFGLGDTVTAGLMTGKVCLIQRGTISFADKVLNCQNSGGVGAIIYNNVAGALFGTLGGVATEIPSVGVSDTDGTALLAAAGSSATVKVGASNYAYFDGTSMATPHVSAVAALVWSNHANCSATQIRNSLNKSALDLGTGGRDVYYGYGLVQAKAAVDRIRTLGCGK